MDTVIAQSVALRSCRFGFAALVYMPTSNAAIRLPAAATAAKRIERREYKFQFNQLFPKTHVSQLSFS